MAKASVKDTDCPRCTRDSEDRAATRLRVELALVPNSVDSLSLIFSVRCPKCGTLWRTALPMVELPNGGESHDG